MADMTRIKDRIQEVIRPNGVGAITAAEHQSLLLEMVDDINSKKADKAELAELAEDKVSHDDLATINGKRIDAGGNIEIEGGMSEEEKAELNEKLTELSAEIGGVDTRVDALEEIHKTLDVTVEKLVTEKVDSMDYAPNLSVGTADNLSGVDVVASDFNFRRSGGGAIADGVARVESIKGNSVVWNQLFDRPNQTITNNGMTSIKNADGSLSISGTLSQIYATFGQFNDNIENHTYLFMLVGGKTLDGKRFSLLNRGVGATISSGFAYFFHKNTDTSLQRQIGFSGFQVDEVVNDTFFVLQIDLTKMFGAGNEPTTIEDFYRLLPTNIDINAYNEGEIIDMRAEGIKSVGVNQWDEELEYGKWDDSKLEWDYNQSAMLKSKNFIPVLPNTQYRITNPSGIISRYVYYDKDKQYISYVSATSNSIFTTPSNACYMMFGLGSAYKLPYNNDICINLSDTEINGKYFPYTENAEDLSIIKDIFPNGMRSAGTAHDEIYYDKTTNKKFAVQRIGSVDLGTLRWARQEHEQGKYTFYCNFKGFLYIDSNTISNTLTSRYIADTWLHVYYATSDKTIAITNNYIRIVDNSFTDAESFMASLQGLICYYELETPIVTEITADIVENPDFNLDYLVQNGGTEQMIATEPSSAIKADITYGFNAVGLIKQLRAMIEALSAKVANL